MSLRQHPDRVRWRHLLPGVAFLAFIVTSVVLVLVYAEIGGVRGTTIPVYAAFGEARDIIPNTEVWLNGERIGVVRSVRFRPPGSAVAQRIMVHLELLERARPYVRRDAVVQVRRGESFLGAPVLYVSGGTPSAPAVRSGDTLTTTIRLDQDQIAVDIRSGFSDARTVLSNVQRAAMAMREARGSISALMGGGDGDDLSEFERVRVALAALASNGSELHSFSRDTMLERRVERIRMSLDSLAITSRAGSARLLQEDSSLHEAVQEVAADVGSLRAEVRSRMASLRDVRGADSAGADPGELERLDAALTMLLSDLRRRPWRYVGF